MRDLRRHAQVIQLVGAKNGLRLSRTPIPRPRRRSAMPRIEIGQLYLKLDGITTIWEVISQMRDAGGVAHVRLRNADDPSTTKLISDSVLRNQRYFRILEPRPLEGAHQAA